MALDFVTSLSLLLSRVVVVIGSLLSAVVAGVLHNIRPREHKENTSYPDCLSHHTILNHLIACFV
jgi:hypothetical protein